MNFKAMGILVDTVRVLVISIRLFINCIQKCILFATLLPLAVSAFELPSGRTLADLELGPRPVGPSDRAVRIVPWAALPGDVQQAAAQGSKLYFAVIEGQVWEFDLQGSRSVDPFLDIASLRQSFATRAPSGGLRGLAFHPDFDSNGLFYTFHEEAIGSGGIPDYGDTSSIASEFILAEWDFANWSNDQPSFREVFRVAFSHTDHNAQQIGFNPKAKQGDSDYGNLYLCLADNGNAPNFTDLHDPFQVGQDFSTIHSSIIRIDPLDPTSFSDEQLASNGLMRSANGKFSIPLDNPFIGAPARRDEIYAKGFRNPLTMSFAPNGKPILGDIGQQHFEEINLIESGANYGWGLREGYFITTYADQSTGDFLGADVSQRLVPFGDEEEPAVDFQLRDADGSNPRQETLARTGSNADGMTYPVAHIDHPPNQWDDQTAIIAGDFYSGVWAEELRGLYLFGNLAWDQVFYFPLGDLKNNQQPVETFLLPFIDHEGESLDFSDIVGGERTNFRFAKDSFGNVYLASKTNDTIYRLQGTPLLGVSILPDTILGARYPVISLTRPGPDSSLEYELEISNNLLSYELVPLADYEVLSLVNLDNGTETITFRYNQPIANGASAYFRFKATVRQPES